MDIFLCLMLLFTGWCMWVNHLDSKEQEKRRKEENSMKGWWLK